MKTLSVEDFSVEDESALQRCFPASEIQILFQTEKSFKANCYLQKNVFIAVPYNARNSRMDFALIRNNQRIFGYDNLKEWHYHPHTNPSGHVPCEKPPIDKIISDIKYVYQLSKDRREKHSQ